jgi:hypothetical protein
MCDQGLTIIVSEVYNNQITQEGSDYEYTIILAISMMDILDILGQKEILHNNLYDIV